MNTDLDDQFDIHQQLKEAQRFYSDFQIIELDDSTNDRLIIFTGYSLGAISATQAYVGIWWSFDGCITVFTVYPDGSTRSAIILNLSDLMALNATHELGDSIFDLIMKHELCAVNMNKGSFEPVYMQ